jgi:hypothetical protein
MVLGQGSRTRQPRDRNRVLCDLVEQGMQYLLAIGSCDFLVDPPGKAVITCGPESPPFVSSQA